IPSAAAVAWGMTVGIQRQSIIDGMSAAGIAFFFILALQGQILRIAKNVRDEQDTEEFRSSFASLQQGIDQLRKQGFTIHQPPASPPPPDDSTLAYLRTARPVSLGFEYFADQAHRAIDTKQYYAAVLLAAVGFEFAARQAASQLGIDSDRA